MSNIQSWEETFAPIHAHNRNVVQMNTWGHLAPQKNTTYRGHVLLSKSGYEQCGGLIDMQWDKIEDSPWLYDMVNDWIAGLDLEEGCVYMIEATMRNWRFWGKPIKLHSIQSWKEFVKNR